MESMGFSFGFSSGAVAVTIGVITLATITPGVSSAVVDLTTSSGTIAPSVTASPTGVVVDLVTSDVTTTPAVTPNPTGIVVGL